MARRQPKRLAALTTEQSISTVFEEGEDAASDESELLDVQHISDVTSEADGEVEDNELNVDSDDDIAPLRSRLRETESSLITAFRANVHG